MTAVFPDNRREQFLEKPLPSSEDSERVILGAVLLDGNVMNECAESLLPEDFYSPLHRRIYAAMQALFASGRTIDPIMIGEELKREGSLDSMGGVATITNLTHGLPHFANVEEYIEIVRKKRKTRDLIRTCSAITSEALAEETTFEELAGSAESQIFSVCENPYQPRPKRLGELVKESLERTKELMASGSEVVGVPSGLKDLDEITGGFRRGNFVLLGARPSMGKSAAAVQWALNAASGDRVVAYFTLEDTDEATTARIIASQARINLKNYRTARLTQFMLEDAVNRTRGFDQKNMYLFDKPGITPMQLFATARRVYAIHKRLDLVVVDYLQLMGSSTKAESRVQEVSQISRELKNVARELNVPLVALSQLSRECEKRNDKRPIMSDLRESGSIEQDADVVIFLYRDEYYKATEENSGLAEFHVAKQKNGPTDTIKAAFLKEFVRFENFFNPNSAQQSF